MSANFKYVAFRNSFRRFLVVADHSIGLNVGVRKLESWAIAWRCLLDPRFSRFDTIPACDIRTDGQTGGHTNTR